MKIIFLDFDGVIRVPVFGGPRIEGEFCDQRMTRVADLATKHNAQIVISSDWRQRHTYTEIVDLLHPLIPRSLIHRDWQTPILQSSTSNKEEVVPRGSEILAWLYRNPMPSQFIILDDLKPAHFPLMNGQLVKCQFQDGFTEERAKIADSMLAS